MKSETGSRKVLMVDDEADFHMGTRDTIEPHGYQLLSAYTVAEGQALFLDNQDVEAIIMDGNVGGRLDTLPLIRDIRSRGYLGTIVAASRELDNRVKMIQAGCDYNLSEKGHLPSTICKVLGLPY